MTPAEKLGNDFVALIKKGEKTRKNREILRDALVRTLMHPVVRSIVAEADYADSPNLSM